MPIIIKNTKKIVFTSFLLTILALSIFIQIPGFQNIIFDSTRDNNKSSEQDLLQASETDYYSEEWIQYGNFSSGADSWWYSDIDGDLTDGTLSISSGEANYIIEGSQFEKSFDDPITTATAFNWVAFNKTEPAMNPDKYTTNDGGLLSGAYFIDDEGFFMNHTWHDSTPDQFVSISWRYNASMGVDMSDYSITSATIDAIMNATVDWNVDTQYCTYAQGTNLINQGGIFDHAYFTIEIATMDLSSIYKIAHNQTNDLGRDDPDVHTIDDKSIDQVGDEQDLIYYLTSLLESDPGHDEFAIIVTMEIQCEDDYTSRDYDDWEELRVKSLNLTMAYEKNIDKLTKLSWNQDADAIPSNYEIENATLNFKYKVDRDWSSTTNSLNSEFRIIINDNQLGETIKLSTATTSYQDIKVGGLDVANFLSADEDVNISIQIYIGDDFILDSDITISIENVSLMLDYGIFTPPDTTSYDLFLEEVNRTTEKSTQVTFNEDLNITLIYKDSIGDFILGADVELTGSGLTPIPLTEGTSDYYTIINSTDLGVGTSYLTITASKRYYTTQEFQITVEVISRDTEIQLFLDTNNKTIEKEWTTEWNENLNITIRYGDIQNPPFTHISEATVELTGVGATKTLIEDSGNEQYEIEINTFDLGVGSTFLTVYASKENFTSLNIRFKITVTTRTTYLDNIILNTTETNLIEIAWNELFDVSVAFNDSLTDDFIDGATVQLIGTGYSETLSQSGQLYNLTVNTFDLAIGNNFLTLLAQKDNYSIASELITITVEERTTTIESILNHTSAATINYPHGELLNITAIYNDLSGPFIDSATVELREGATVIYTLTESSSFDQYSVVINTNELNVGVHLLTLYAKQDNYSAAFESITLIIDERDTSLEIYLEDTLTTVIERDYDESINITVIYNDFDNASIDGATVELRQGETILDTFTPNNNQYTLIQNTNVLSLGSNVLSIYAKKENYSVAIVSISIIVTERDTDLTIFLDDVERTAIEVTYGELVNITAMYNDLSGPFIDGATVELREGSTVLDTLSLDIYQYVLMTNSNKFNLGSNVLSIYAKKENYSVSLVSILITVNERDTTLDVLLNDIDSSAFEFFNISINEVLNITAIYEDITPIFISSATVELTGLGISETLTLHSPFNQYNYTLNPEVLGVGVHFLVISADIENYTSSIKNIKLNVLERGSNLELHVDGADITSSRYIAAEIDQTLNITVYFTDSSDDSFIPSASLKLTGALNDNLTENAILEHYNVSIRTNDLEQGINFLTIFAQKQEYVSQSIVFTIEVIEKASDLQLFLNGYNETLGKSIEVTVGELINVTVIYEDYTNLFIDSAEVIIVGEGIDLNLTKHLVYDQYNVTIDSDDLNFGINLLTLYANRINYQPQTLIIRIEIIEKETDLHIFLNGFNKTIDRSLTLPIRSSLNVTVKYLDYDTGLGLSGATIQLVGEGLSLYLTENPSLEHYSISINTTQLDIGVRFLTIYAQSTNYQSFSALLRIQVDRIQTNITTVSGETVINRQPGQNYILEINLLDLDFSTDILNATVTYTWAYGQGTLTDPEDDGIYEGTILNLREGTFVVTISVYADDDYEFERFTVTLNVVRPVEDVLLFQVLTILGVSAALGLGGYLFAYQRVLKYPKQVRKIRKYRSNLKKQKAMGIEIRSRDQLIEDNYAEKMHPLEKQLKSKIAPKAGKNKIQKDTLEQSENNQNNFNT